MCCTGSCVMECGGRSMMEGMRIAIGKNLNIVRGFWGGSGQIREINLFKSAASTISDNPNFTCI